MDIQSARFTLSDNNQLVPMKTGTPKNLEEAKEKVQVDSNTKASHNEATEMLNDFRKAAHQLSTIDDQNYRPAPQEPGFFRSLFHDDEYKAWQHKTAENQEFNGKDVSPEAGHVITTADTNNRQRDAEMVFTPGHTDFGAKDSLLTNVTSFDQETKGNILNPNERYHDSYDHGAASKETWHFAASADKDVYKRTSQLAGDSKFARTETLTVDHKSRIAEFQVSDNLGAAPQFEVSDWDDENGAG